MGGRAHSCALRTRKPVPGTVEIESQYEIDTSAAVPGTPVKVSILSVLAPLSSNYLTGR